jgi:hypothetical protein
MKSKLTDPAALLHDLDRIDNDINSVIRIGRFYQNIVRTAYSELILALASCPTCGAKVDEKCRNRSGRTSDLSHVGRRVFVEEIRWKHRKRYNEFRSRVIRHCLKAALDAIKNSW